MKIFCNYKSFWKWDFKVFAHLKSKDPTRLAFMQWFCIPLSKITARVMTPIRKGDNLDSSMLSDLRHTKLKINPFSFS